MNQKKIDRWLKAKELYTQGRQTDKGLKYPTYDEIAGEVGLKSQTLRVRSAKENWTLLRKQMIAKVENLTREKKSTVMAGESVEFDSECLRAARKGVQIINTELDTAATAKAPENATTEEAIEWILARKGAVATFGKALTDYQKAGRLAFGESSESDKPPQINISVVSEKSKKLTDEIVKGKGTE